MADFKYLALGDSYTIGEGVAPDMNFPNQVVRLLRDSGHVVADPVIIATTGWTTFELMDGITKNPPAGLFDFVTLLIGVNNQYRKLEVEDYASDFEQLLVSAISFAGNDPKRTIVVSIPDWSVSPFAADLERSEIAAAIDTFNAVNERLTYKYGAQYVNITPGSRHGLNDTTLFTTDNLHPSAVEYLTWATTITHVISASLKVDSQGS